MGREADAGLIEGLLPLQWGRPLQIERLGGLSGAAVFRVQAPNRSVICKTSVSSREIAFYRTVAPQIEAAGIHLPSVAEAGNDWLLLEEIPHALPRERWRADSELLDVLRRLHGLSPALPQLMPDRYVPQWTETMTQRALSWLPAETASTLRPILDEARQRSAPLFEPLCPISADPNPSNWGLRENGQLVLFDWERFTLGTPAIDLAITVPGLGGRDAYALLAREYLGREDADALTEQIMLAKLWIIVEFLSICAEGKMRFAEPPEWLIREFPGWMRDVSGASI